MFLTQLSLTASTHPGTGQEGKAGQRAAEEPPRALRNLTGLEREVRARAVETAGLEGRASEEGRAEK